MELEKQVCSLELAKRLKELGAKQESCFDWVEIDDNEHLLMGRKQKEFDKISDDAKARCWSAFTVAELGERLPHFVDGAGYIQVPDRIGQGTGWWANVSGKWADSSATEADARAKMLVYLIENKLV